MTDAKRDEMKDRRRDSLSTGDDATVIAPRFDERESATARPVVPLDMSAHGDKSIDMTGGTGAAAGGFSLRAVSRHLVLAWAVIATLAAGAFAVYRNAQTAEPPVTQQPATENTAVGATATPQPARRDVPKATARPPKITEARDSSPSWEVPDWSDRGDAKRDEPADEELDERARKEEKKQRKEEKKRREEFEKETERALKEARKRAERLRERMKDEGGARLIGVLTGRSGM